MNSATQYHEVLCSITVYEVAMSLQVCQCVGIICRYIHKNVVSCVEKLHYLVDTRGIKNNWQRSNAMVTCVCVLQSAIKLCCHHGLLLINTRNTTSVFPYCALNLSIRQKIEKEKSISASYKDIHLSSLQTVLKVVFILTRKSVY